MRITHGLAWGLIALTAAGCSSWQSMHLSQLSPPNQPPQQAPLKLRKQDGSKVTLRDWTLAADTLRGTHEVWEEYTRVQRTESFSVAEVTLEDGDVGGEELHRALDLKQQEAKARADAQLTKERESGLPGKIRVQLRDGKLLTLTSPSVVGDSLLGFVFPTDTRLGEKQQVRLAMKDVQVIESRRFQLGNTLGLLLGTGLVVAVVWAILVASAMGD